MFRIELVEDERSLEALTAPWWELWRRAPDATPFRSPAWLGPWWRAFSPGRLATVAVWAGPDLAALAPAYVEDGSLGRRLLPLGIGISDDLDILCDPAHANEALPGLAVALAALPGVDVWEFEELAPGATAWRLPLPAGLTEEVADQSACPVLPLSGEDGLGAVPSRQRRKLRMARHRTARRGGEVREVDAPDLDAFLQDLRRLHGARWRSRGEGGVLDSDAVERFHRAALPRLAEAGLADLLVLEIEGRAVGAHYGLRTPGRAYAYLGGFDPAFAFESPGTVLLGEAIARASAQGAREMHMLRGQEAYKYAWGATDRPNRRRSWRRTGA